MSIKYLQPENIADPAITRLEDLRYKCKGEKCTGAVCGLVGNHMEMKMHFKGSRCGTELGWRVPKGNTLLKNLRHDEDAAEAKGQKQLQICGMSVPGLPLRKSRYQALQRWCR